MLLVAAEPYEYDTMRARKTGFLWVKRSTVLEALKEKLALKLRSRLKG